MHSVSTLALATVLALFPAAGAPLQEAQDRGGLAELVAGQADQAAELRADEIWARVQRIQDAARALDGEDLGAAAERALGAGELTPGAVLLVSALALGESEPPVELLAERLVPVLGEREDLARGAAELLQNPHFRALGEDAHGELIESVREAALDAGHSPELRLDASQVLFLQGDGAARREARDLMQEFLKSSDSELRALGALALAQSGAIITGELYDELYRLSILPGERGRRAAAYIQREEVREELNRKLKRSRDYYEGAEPTGEPAASPSDLKAIEQLIAAIERWHLEGDRVTREELIEAGMDGMLRRLDTHSAYLSPKAYKQFEQELEAHYGGIGAYVGEGPDDGLFTITHPIYSGPAWKAGLMSEDKIVRIDDWPTLGQPVDDIIKRLKGRPGTSVKLYVWRRGMDAGLIDRPTEEMMVEIERAAISIPSVQQQMLPGQIGLVSLHEFSRVATTDVSRAIDDLLEQGMRGLVFDLRNNSGGLLDEAVDVAGLFLPKDSLVVMTESRLKPTEELKTRSNPKVPADMPMAVLVNRYSASAAEIVSGALQDHGRAVLIGQRTFGKGSVQNLLPVTPSARDDEYEDENKNGRYDNWEPITKDHDKDGEFDFAPRVKMTIAKYLLPSGRSIHHEVDKDGNVLSPGGVEPEIELQPERIEAWRIEEMIRVRNSHAPREYVDRHWSEYNALFHRLAENDRKDTSLYPMWDEFAASIETPLPQDDLRQLVRMEIRRRVQDARGQEFPPGDFVEDLQVQEAIRQVLAQRGEDPADIPDYAAVMPTTPTPEGTLVARGESPKVGARPSGQTLDQALAELEGELSAEDLAKVRRALAEAAEGER
jgi:carboxyl-terminal processing protease